MVPGRLSGLYRCLLCLRGDPEGDSGWLLDDLCVCGRRFRGNKTLFASDLFVNLLEMVCQKSCISHMVSAVWVLRCSVLFRKESTSQLCRGLTEVQDTISMLSRSWFTFINVKESIFKCTAWILCLGFWFLQDRLKIDGSRLFKLPWLNAFFSSHHPLARRHRSVFAYLTCYSALLVLAG